MYWAVDLEDKLHGPFPNSKRGRVEAMTLLSVGEPFHYMGGCTHPGFIPRHPLEEVTAVAGVVEVPPDDLPVDLFPKGRFSRSEILWMRERYFGTAYRTKLVLIGDAVEVEDAVESPDPFAPALTLVQYDPDA